MYGLGGTGGMKKLLLILVSYTALNYLQVNMCLQFALM